METLQTEWPLKEYRWTNGTVAAPAMPRHQCRSLLFAGAIFALLTGFAGEARAASIKGWWRFDGNFNDETVTGLTGTAMGEPEFSPTVPSGLTGQSLFLNNDAEGVKVAANPILNAQEFTLGYYINLQGIPPGTSGLERLTGRQGYRFETAVGDANAIGGNSSPNGLTFSYYSPSTGWRVTNIELPATGWVHVTWRNSAAEMLLFLNGVQVYSGAPVTSAISGFMNFGTAQDNREGFGGLMDDAFFSDGLLTPAEILLIAQSGVAAFAGDTDGDGLPNTWETQYGLNPNDNTGANGATGNGDNDGLTNLQEFTRGTDPTKADTDSDGLNDGPEVTLGTNPLLADTDGDGLSDGNEVTATTDPLVFDTDGDGAGDGDEVAGGSNPKDPGSLPPPSALLSLWLKFEGDTLDSSPKANNGTLLDLPAFVTDDSPGGGQALSFTQNQMGVSVPGNNTLATNVFTLSYWVKPTTLQEDPGFERLTSRNGDAFETAIGSRGGVDLNLSYYQGAWTSSGASLVLNEWAHVAWRNKGVGVQDMTLWVNGVKVFTGPGVPAGRPGNGLMNIGTRWNGVEGFEGLMDDVRLYRAALGDSDMTALATPSTGDAYRFEFTSVVRAAGGATITLKIRSKSNRVYAVDYCTDLNAARGTPGGWVELTDALPSTGSETQFSTNVGANLQRAYYQARDVTPP